PAVGFEALADVVGICKLGRAVDCDVVVVIYIYEAPEAEMARQRGRLVADALHEVAVAAAHEDMVIDQLRAEVRSQEALGDSHAYGIGETLAQRPGRDLDTRQGVDLGVARSTRSPLAELAEVLEL